MLRFSGRSVDARPPGACPPKRDHRLPRTRRRRREGRTAQVPSQSCDRPGVATRPTPTVPAGARGPPDSEPLTGWRACSCVQVLRNPEITAEVRPESEARQTGICNEVECSGSSGAGRRSPHNASFMARKCPGDRRGHDGAPLTQTRRVSQTQAALPHGWPSRWFPSTADEPRSPPSAHP